MSPLLLLPAALARPEAPDTFCATYADSPHCAAGAASCAVCHDTAGAPVLNPYGTSLQERIDGDFLDSLPGVLAAVEGLDADADGLDNRTEIDAGSWPGFADEIEPECLPQVASGSDYYAVGHFDPYFAWRRITIDFCGRSPRYEEVVAFEAKMADLGQTRGDADAGGGLDEAVVALLHDQLGACLQSPYWSEALTEIGVGVVRPRGYNSDLYILGNYEWDLRLFRYAASEDRDIGDLMTADYFVVEEPAGTGQLVAIDEPRTDTEAYAQPLAAEHRYGLITTRFSLAMNVMFAPVPRTLTAHWYRELLGLDIAMNEGLYPIDEQDGALEWDAPLDVDDKGVWQEDCAACHTTIDPLSYPWARYNGIDLEDGNTGAWLAERAADILPQTDGAIFGAAVSGPEDWVAEAVASDAFASRMTELLWTWLFRRAPYSCEEGDFELLWRDLRDGTYDTVQAEPRNIEAMLHDLVLMEAYGTP